MWSISLLNDFDWCICTVITCLFIVHLQHCICNARLLAQIIRLNAQFLDYSIKIIHLNNANEFTFKMFNDYCTSISIDVEHLIPHVHTQNGWWNCWLNNIYNITNICMNSCYFICCGISSFYTHRIPSMFCITSCIVSTTW